MAVTFSDIILDALSEINAITPGVAQPAADMQLGLTRGNAFLDSTAARSVMQYVQRLDAYVFGTTKQTYTIGRGTPAADFVADRPVDILDASIVLTSANPNVFIPVAILNSEEWASLQVLDYLTSVPTALWYEPTFPNGRIHLRGQPNLTGYELRILTNQQLGQAASLATVFSFPPGGYEMVMYSIAERLCNAFGKVGDIKADITMKARAARTLFSSVNTETPRIVLEGLPLHGRGPYYNYLDGSLVYR